MELKILGSGTIAGKGNCSSYLIKIGDRFILLDCGPGAYAQLIKSGINMENLMSIFITHTHVDHVNDLPALLWRFMYGTRRKNPLTIFGPKGFKKFFIGITRQYPQIKNTKFSIKIGELSNRGIRLGNIKVISKQVAHAKYSNAYRIEFNKKSIVYSGDTDYCDEIVELAKNADILILECSMPDDKKSQGHLTPKLCSKIASLARVKKLVLTHFYPDCERINIISIIKKSKEFKGGIEIASDCSKYVIC